VGSGGIAVDATSNPESPRLLVAEYGEGRIIRLEDNGARTPVVIQLCGYSGNEPQPSQEENRLAEPFRLLVTPYKDLMIMDNRTSLNDGYQLWRMPKVISIPPLPSLAVSRKAHAWTRMNDTGVPPPQLFFQSPAMGGMVMDPSGQRMYVTTMDQESSSIMVVSLPLDDDDNDADDDEYGKEDGAAKKFSRDLLSRQSKIILDYTKYSSSPGAIEIDHEGNIFLAVDRGILVVSRSTSFMALINFSLGDKIVDLTVGSDRFLYIATKTKLARIRIPGKPLDIKRETLLKAFS
jgi:hypothetical protein